MAELEGPKSATTSRAWGQPHVGEMRDLFTGTWGPDIECSCGPKSEMSTETPRRGCQSQTPGHLLPSQEMPRPEQKPGCEEIQAYYRNGPSLSEGTSFPTTLAWGLPDLASLTGPAEAQVKV